MTLWHYSPSCFVESLPKMAVQTSPEEERDDENEESMSLQINNHIK